jgi:hypothetical protein
VHASVSGLTSSLPWPPLRSPKECKPKNAVKVALQEEIKHLKALPPPNPTSDGTLQLSSHQSGGSVSYGQPVSGRGSCNPAPATLSPTGGRDCAVGIGPCLDRDRAAGFAVLEAGAERRHRHREKVDLRRLKKHEKGAGAWVPLRNYSGRRACAPAVPQAPLINTLAAARCGACNQHALQSAPTIVLSA